MNTKIEKIIKMLMKHIIKQLRRQLLTPIIQVKPTERSKKGPQSVQQIGHLGSIPGTTKYLQK